MRRNKKHTKIRYTGLFLGNDHEVQNIWSHEELDYYSKNINPLTEEDLISVSDEGLRAYKNVNNYSIMYVNGKRELGPIITIPEPHPLFNCHYIYSEEEFDFGRMQGVTKDHPINDAIEVIMDQVGPFFDSIEYVDVTNRYTEEQ